MHLSAPAHVPRLGSRHAQLRAPALPCAISGRRSPVAQLLLRSTVPSPVATAAAPPEGAAAGTDVLPTEVASSPAALAAPEIVDLLENALPSSTESEDEVQEQALEQQGGVQTVNADGSVTFIFDSVTTATTTTSSTTTTTTTGVAAVATQATSDSNSSSAAADTSSPAGEQLGGSFPTASTLPLPEPLAVSPPLPDAASAAAAPVPAPAPAPTPSTPGAAGSSSRIAISILDERDARMREERPLIPTVDLPSLVDVLFGNPGVRPELQALFKLADQGSSPRMYTPGVERPAGAPPATTLPLLVYLPGIDGTGLAAYRQFPSLLTRFDLRALFIPPADRSSFDQLTSHVARLLKQELKHCDPSRPVYLLGESFGGLLALALTQLMPGAIDRIVLVNPATSFENSPWKRIGPALTSLPPQLYNALPIALSPIIANPFAMAMNGVDTSAPLPRQISDAAYSLIDLIPELSALRQALPPDTLAWRLNLLGQGAAKVNRLLKRVPQRTLLLVGQLDLVIPSDSEGPRLQKAMPRCRLRVMPLRSHAMLQEAGVDLVKILDEEGFYQRTRQLSSAPKTPTPPTPSTPSTPAKRAAGSSIAKHAAPAASVSAAGAAAAAAAVAVKNEAGAAVAVAAKAGEETQGQTGGWPAGSGGGAVASNGSNNGVVASNGNGSGAAGSGDHHAQRHGAEHAAADAQSNGSGDHAHGSAAHAHANGDGAQTHAHTHSRAHSHGHEQPKTAKGFGADAGHTGTAEAGAGEAVPLAGAGINFGSAAGPLQMPTDRELELALDSGGLKPLRQLVSPVFFSTDSSGRVQRGLGAIPDSRPLLFVGNHQLLAPDTPLMIAEFLQERRMLLRGLAHPLALQGMASPDEEDGEEGQGGATAANAPFGAFLKTFGAVPVSGPNLYKLLSQNEAALLYPGGAREAMKRRGEKYALLWPKKAEFVRMACRFGATIIPFAAIGAEDSYNIVRDSAELMKTPVIGDLLRRQGQSGGRDMPAARKGVNAVSEEERELLEETFKVPLLTFNAPARFYFVCRQPIVTDPSMLRDKAATEKLYGHIKSEVEGGISYLLQRRERDPYSEFGPRIMWELSRGGKEQAPTFEP